MKIQKCYASWLGTCHNFTHGTTTRRGGRRVPTSTFLKCWVILQRIPCLVWNHIYRVSPQFLMMFIKQCHPNQWLDYRHKLFTLWVPHQLHSNLLDPNTNPSPNLPIEHPQITLGCCMVLQRCSPKQLQGAREVLDVVEAVCHVLCNKTTSATTTYCHVTKERDMWHVERTVVSCFWKLTPLQLQSRTVFGMSMFSASGGPGIH